MTQQLQADIFGQRNGDPRNEREVDKVDNEVNKKWDEEIDNVDKTMNKQK